MCVLLDLLFSVSVWFKWLNTFFSLCLRRFWYKWQIWGSGKTLWFWYKWQNQVLKSQCFTRSSSIHSSNIHMIRYDMTRWVLWNSSSRIGEFGWIGQNSRHSNLCALKWQHHQTELWDVCQSLVTVCLKHLKCLDTEITCFFKVRRW